MNVSVSVRVVGPVAGAVLLGLVGCGSTAAVGPGGGGASTTTTSTSSTGGSGGATGSTGTAGDGGAACADGGGCAPSRLSVSGAQILDPNGTPIILRGWNWGQWGTAQPQDGADNVTQHANVVRVPLRWWGQYGDPSVDAYQDGAPGNIEPGHLTALDAVIQEATAAHLWVDLFVDSNCGQASVSNDTASYCGTVGGSPANFLNDPAMKQKFVDVWTFLAGRYKDTPYIGMYEILPEPSFTCTATACSDYSTAPTFYASIIPSIRAVDPRTPILVGPDNGYDVRHIATAYIPGVSGLIYTADFLSYASTHPEWLSYATSFRTAKNVPISSSSSVCSRRTRTRRARRTPCSRTSPRTASAGRGGLTERSTTRTGAGTRPITWTMAACGKRTWRKTGRPGSPRSPATSSEAAARSSG